MAHHLVIEPGHWYIGVSCKGCGKPRPLAHDPSGGKINLVGEGILLVTCHECGLEANYTTAETQHFKAEQFH